VFPQEVGYVCSCQTQTQTRTSSDSDSCIDENAADESGGGELIVEFIAKYYPAIIDVYLGKIIHLLLHKNQQL
jgi:hypothetical protein